MFEVHAVDERAEGPLACKDDIFKAYAKSYNIDRTPSRSLALLGITKKGRECRTLLRIIVIVVTNIVI